MFVKSLYIASALAGALVWSAAAQAAPAEITGNVQVIAARHRHYYEPAWLYDHIIDQTNPSVGHGRGLPGYNGTGGGGGHDFVGGMGGGHGLGGGEGTAGHGHGGGNGGGHGGGGGGGNGGGGEAGGGHGR